MTMLLIQTGLDKLTGTPRFGYAHPFLIGARKRHLSVPDVHVTKKTKRVVPARRAIAPGSDRPVQVEKYNRANR
jgi:hypothetical protein